MMSLAFEDWETSLQRHAEWVRQAYPDCGLSDDYIEGLIDESSYGISLAVKFAQTAFLLAVFGWFGEAAGSRIESQYSSTISLLLASFGFPVAYFFWSKSSPIHEYLIRRCIRKRLRDLQAD